MEKSEDRIRDLWDTIKQINPKTMGVTLGETKVNKKEDVLKEKKNQKLPKSGMKIDIQIQEN